MSDRADEPLAQTAIARLAELEVAQFIRDALRTGQRAILVTGRGQSFMRVPEAALAACASGSVRTLHIGPPLPEPPELQEMIGAAVGIADGREKTPQAMARLLLADPRQTVILAINDAHTLPPRSLNYLALMTELRAPLQIVLAAGPAMLDTLAQPEFERFRNTLCRLGFERFPTFHLGRANGSLSGPRMHTLGRAAAGLAHVRNANLGEASLRSDGIARPGVYAAIGIVAIGCLAAVGYIAFPAFAVRPTPAPTPSLNSAAPDRFLAPSGPSPSLAQLRSRQTDDAIDPLIDEAAAAVAGGSSELASSVLARIGKLEAGALPEGPKLMSALRDRLAAAAAAGDVDEARRLVQVYRLIDSAIGSPNPLAASNPRPSESPSTAIPGASGADKIGDRPQQREIAERPRFPPSGSALSTEQLGPAGDGEGAALSPSSAAPGPPSAAPDQNVDVARPAMLAKAAPTPPAALAAEQLGAASDGDRTALPSSAAAPAPPSATPDQEIDATRAAISAEAAPPPPPTAYSAERLDAASAGDRAASSPSAAAPTRSGAVPDQNIDAARGAILAEVAPPAPPTAPHVDGAQSAISAEAVPPPLPTAYSAERLGATSDGDRAVSSSNAAAPTSPSAAPDQNIDAARSATLVKPAPTARPTAVDVAGLPTAAPVRVVLSVARENVGRSGRAAEIQQALVAAGLEVADLVPVDAERSRASIGYYFQSDRAAADGVSHLLEPLLGPLDPVALRMRESIPEPGTIEIAIP